MPPTDRPRLRFWAAVALAAYGVFVLVTVFWPEPVDRPYSGAIVEGLSRSHERGLPEVFGYSQVEFTANIGMFVPMGFFAALALPSRRWWLAVPALAAFSIGIEVVQGLVLPARFSSVADVIANSLGGLAGAALAWGIATVIRRRRTAGLDRD